MKKIATGTIGIVLACLAVILLLMPLALRYESPETAQGEVDSALNPTAIQEGAIYLNLDTKEVFEAMPEEIQNGDAYLYQDYLYIYGLNHSYGWQVALATSDGYWNTTLNDSWVNVDLETVFVGKLVSMDKTAYSDILESINGVPVLIMDGCFMNCTRLVEAPAIPGKIGSMSDAFSGCTALTTAPVIGGNVSCIDGAFRNCASLKGTVEINANVSVCDACFENVNMNQIDLIGTSIHLDKIGATGLNWNP